MLPSSARRMSLRRYKPSKHRKITMIKYLTILIFSLSLIGCKESSYDKLSIYSKENLISYEEAQIRCQNIKDETPLGNTEDCMCNAMLPEFSITTIEGKDIQSKDLTGRPTIVNFWFTTCAPCIAEVPGFNTLEDKYRDKINFLSIARNSKSEIEEFLKINPWNFDHISNDTNIIDSVFNHQFGYPTTFLIDKNGVIIRSFTGGATGDQAGYYLQKRIVFAIEEVLRTSPLESRELYQGNIGNLENNPNIDDQSFILCNKENQIMQYFSDGNGLQYIDEKAEILKEFHKNYKSNKSNTDTGVLTLRFIVNCQGETDRFRLYEMDNNYQEIKFSKSVSDQILSIAKSLKGWKSKKLNGTPIDYYQILSFKIEQGEIIDILP